MPDKTGKLGDRGLRIKAVDIADFSDDTGGVDLANARNGGQSVRDDLKLLFNGLIQYLDLFFQGTHRGNGNGHGLIHGIIYRLWQPVGAFGRSPYRLGCGIRVEQICHGLLR